MRIPKHTHQQFAVLDTLLKEGELWGRDLRSALKAEGYGSSNSSFYELMDRLEKVGFVEGRYEERDVLGQLFRERKYKLTGLGQQARDEVASYYMARLRRDYQGGQSSVLLFKEWKHRLTGLAQRARDEVASFWTARLLPSFLGGR
ncbi:MAG: helix-turn-helix transcriptional regulator [Isosphaeraceae bacterium]